MRFWKKAACLGLAAITVLTSACSGGDATWSYQSGDLKAPTGLYIIYMINAASQAEEKLAEENADNAEYEDPTYKDLLKTTVEGKDASQWIQEDAQQKLKEYFAVEQKFQEEELTLDEENQANVQVSAENTWQTYGEFYETNGVAQSSMELQMANSLKRESLFYHYYGEGGSNEVSDQELKDLFAKDYAKVEFMVFGKAQQDTVDSEGVVVETKDSLDAATKTRVEGFLKRFQDGEAFEDLVYEQEKEDAETTGGDPSAVTKPEAGSRTMILSNEHKGSYYSDELIDGAMAAKVGEPVLVEDSSFFYILRRVDILEDPQSFEDYKDNLLNGLKYDEFDEMVSGWADEVSMELNQTVIDQYKPSKLKIDE